MKNKSNRERRKRSVASNLKRRKYWSSLYLWFEKLLLFDVAAVTRHQFRQWSREKTNHMQMMMLVNFVMQQAIYELIFIHISQRQSSCPRRCSRGIFLRQRLLTSPKLTNRRSINDLETRFFDQIRDNCDGIANKEIAKLSNVILQSNLGISSDRPSNQSEKEKEDCSNYRLMGDF